MYNVFSVCVRAFVPLSAPCGVRVRPLSCSECFVLLPAADTTPSKREKKHLLRCLCCILCRKTCILVVYTQFIECAKGSYQRTIIEGFRFCNTRTSTLVIMSWTAICRGKLSKGNKALEMDARVTPFFSAEIVSANNSWWGKISEQYDTPHLKYLYDASRGHTKWMKVCGNSRKQGASGKMRYCKVTHEIKTSMWQL